jgi:hypothetical protein
VQDESQFQSASQKRTERRRERDEIAEPLKRWNMQQTREKGRRAGEKGRKGQGRKKDGREK